MQVRTVRRPGEKGTRKLLLKYGERLVCVRYRYDPENRKRFKTVELIVDETDWAPPEHAQALSIRAATQKLPVQIGYHETELRCSVKRRGGIWSARERLWWVPVEVIESLGLQARAIKRS